MLIKYLTKYYWFCSIVLITSFFSALQYYTFDISSDDALFFQRALQQFSVLEFSPHFPGYPAFVWLERLVFSVSEHANSNVIVSFTAAIFLVIFVMAYSQKNIVHKGLTILAVLIYIQQGSLAELALNGLSDAPALAIFALYLLANQYQEKYLISPTHQCSFSLLLGILLGLCLATRPSYFPLVTAALFSSLLLSRQSTSPQQLAQTQWKRLIIQLFGIAIIGCIAAFYVFMHDGWAYLQEAQRFTQGHFQIWGNTSGQTKALIWQWFDALKVFYSLPSLLVLILSLLGGLLHKQTRYLTLIMWLWLAWVVSGQNPANIRHIAILSLLTPIVFIQLIDYLLEQSFITTGLRKKISIVLFLGLVSNSVYFVSHFTAERNTPSQQVIQYLQTYDTQQVIISNYHIATLQSALPQHIVLDNYYQASSLYQASSQNQGYWRLSSSVLPAQPEKIFPARYLGERQLYLYHFSDKI